MNNQNKSDIFDKFFNSEESRNNLKYILENIFNAEVNIKLKDNLSPENPFEEAYNKAYDEGYQEGEIDGYIQKEEEAIQNMLDMNLDIDFIAKSLDVDKKQIELLK